MQIERRHWVIGFFPLSWLFMVLPWHSFGRGEGTLLCIGPLRFGWR